MREASGRLLHFARPMEPGNLDTDRSTEPPTASSHHDPQRAIMPPRLRPSVRPLAALLLGSFLAAACSDAAVEKARSDRETVTAEASAYAAAIRATAGGDAVHSALEGIASRLEPLARDGDAAANLLLARVRLDLGRRHLDAAVSEETRIAARRSAAMTTLAAAAAFAAGADELRGVAFDAERRALEGARTAAEGGVSSSEALLQEIDRQTRVRETEIARLGRSVREAEEQATSYRELAAREDVVGAPEFLALAAEARRAAGRFRVGIADERSRLVDDANRTPRHTRASGDLAVASADVAGSSRGIETLASIDASIRRQVEAMAETADALRRPVLDAAMPESPEPILGGERIGAELEAARSAFAAAAGAAGRAASGGERSLQSSARVLEMNARFGELSVDLVDAERLASEARLVAELGASPSDATRLRESADEVRGRAEAALASLEGSLDAFAGNGPVAEMLQAAFVSAVERLSDAEAPATSADETTPAAVAAGTGSAAPAGPPFSSADALANFIATGAISNASPAELEQVLTAGSRGGKRMLNATLEIARVSDEVRLAMIEVFGTAASSSPGGFGTLEEGEILSRGDGEAEFGTVFESVRLLEQRGVWRIDYEDLLASSGMDDPAALAATAGMMEAASGRLGPFFRMFAQRIRNGEFATVEAANVAMTETVAQAIMGGAGQGAGQPGGRR